ncbi:MAG: hypothetical protein K0U93_05335 [Gammaproteobacteria bacterium]|nr:hypothetical protein [Gammaproteobacteria bacterium]
MTAYAQNGLIGMLTPQANTTVEPEMWALLPTRTSLVSARLTSKAPALADRLIEYLNSLPTTCEQFANAPLTAIGFACTGASYLAGRQREATIVRRVEDAQGVPCVTSALAIVRALRALDAESIALISPYDDALTEASVSYWESHDFSVAQLAAAAPAESAFHPIYGISEEQATSALRRMHRAPVDAVVLLGTGMPTLNALALASDWDGPAVVSCNFALAWATSAGQSASTDSLRSWQRGMHWLPRAELLFPYSRPDN